MNKKGGWKELFEIFFSFFKIGLFTIGGGLAMVPLMEKIAVKDKKWLTEEEMIDCIAIGQSMPGVIAVNTATYIGNRKRGFAGALAATAGVILPSFIVIVLIVAFLGNYSDNRYVKGALMGVKAAICGLVSVVVFNMAKRAVKDVFGCVVAIITFIAVAFLNITVILIIVAAALAGYVYLKVREERDGEI